MSKNYPEVVLKADKENFIRRGHPWIFSGAIKYISEEISDGSVVKVFTVKKQFICMGHFFNGSIAVKILSLEEEQIDQAFFEKKIRAAQTFRDSAKVLDTNNTNAYRLVFGEADGLPGLIIDRYDNHFIIQCHSIGMHFHISDIANSIEAIYGKACETIYDKSKETLPKNYAQNIENKFLKGNTEKTICKENGCEFYVDWVNGQKTGFFLDQRDNRSLVKHYAKDRKVLNTFCYTGGFSVYAEKGGALEVMSTDVSKKAIALTTENMLLNKCNNHQEVAADTFDFLKANKNVYDLIILDPPAFAKHQKDKHAAVIGYKRLNEMAMSQIAPNGILFTFSCSQAVQKELFFDTVTAAAIEANREIRVLHYLSQPADHPLNPKHAEGEYLKGLVVMVL
jgi:23S rRNA (cytosine1962-C5)-methyltransferase